ncbi:phosphoglucomutase/phosphomannomutase family protein [Aphanizomenon flos-aquae NRERC-008]|uniref:Phosphoglucomutase/phosphomannomutase family protein n=1 Tax=Aphanizomenon flos-aquae FACHB-1249 TaxID=2692889 RepID=A0ABR8IUF1_APHFL|nr:MULTISPECIES: phosphoglucomutase/phosphomannomutase family protein [Aphanizomenon]MBD2390800.1 phosphoglucomutase/phosphomannomutase family protein [Aphanizomenon flos-aquae FACHB-1171]MBD2556356.1 phosphoglucomutase/phosphomannomutase family protein [Aphanizomenon flos-aquae FACHB-1290]MBD2631799.1 phosphoglucomutase/phosphomannomutase family protein [Aphanizomenon sp. FACHB-1399]MBD2642666.1 phosphoglucomutase/phosphomannomutase family protein [Aphanizomenon sp. FACHB-1401]MBD2657525.1 ph
MSVVTNPIKFGTDGWRGVIGEEFTFERLSLVATVAAQVLHNTYFSEVGSQTIIVGYDRRFMAEEFARVVANAVTAVGFNVLFSETFAPTPAYSWAAKELKALGALVVTASHNPGTYLGLKVKSAFGGSVPPEVTQEIEALLSAKVTPAAIPGQEETFNPWPSYCQALAAKVDINKIKEAIATNKLTIFVDVMHGAAAGGLARLLGEQVKEINSERDPLFEGGAPEPLPKYLSRLFTVMKNHREINKPGLTVGLVFDGDCDRIAAVDQDANFLSSQILIPILIDHLTLRRNFQGEIVKTVSGSDLMPRVAALHNLSIHETAVGYKYIADRMLATQVLLGGEESGGIGYGSHIPERDALLSALYVLEAVVESGLDLGEYYRYLQQQTGFSSSYDRIDLPLANMQVRGRLLDLLQSQPLTEIAGKSVISCQTIDGYKFRLVDQSWLMIRFSGTEPVLRLYCEASTPEEVHKTLAWAKIWAESN